MKKKIFTLLTLLLTMSSGVWAADAVSATRNYTNAGKTCTWKSVNAVVKNTTAFGADGLLFQTIVSASNGVKMGDSNNSVKVYEIGDKIFLEVASASSTGSVTVKANGNNANRKLKLKATATEIPMATAGTTVNFTSSDLTQIGGKYYIEISFYDNSANVGEYKLLASEPFSVTLTSEEVFPGYSVDTASPVITTDLLTTDYDASVGIGLDLTIVASHVTGYQWYSCDDDSGTNPVEIVGATEATYTYTATAGDAETTKYFFCVVTNDDAAGAKTATSNVATVNVGAIPTLTAVSYQIWNISDFTNATYSTASIVNNLEICNGTIDAGSKNIDGFTLAKRIKLNKDETATTRYIKFKVDGPCVITVYGMTGSSSKTRVLGIKVAGTEVATLSHSGSDMGKKSYSYTGSGEADVVLFCKEGDGTFNVHGITVSNIAASISAYDWSTFVTDKPLALGGIDGLEAYIVTGHTANAIEKVQMTETVPANTPLLLKGTANATYYIPMAGGSSTNVSSNLLQAGDGSDVAAEDGKTKYVLSVSGGVAGFKKITAGNPATVATGKAYLQFDEVIAARDFFSFDENATAINKVEAKKVENGVFYNLAGQQVAQPTKGLYIVNGKKVIIK